MHLGAPEICFAADTLFAGTPLWYWYTADIACWWIYGRTQHVRPDSFIGALLSLPIIGYPLNSGIRLVQYFIINIIIDTNTWTKLHPHALPNNNIALMLKYWKEFSLYRGTRLLRKIGLQKPVILQKYIIIPSFLTSMQEWINFEVGKIE
jgi:hypothetical protein